MARIELDRPDSSVSISGNIGPSRLVIGRFSYGIENLDVKGSAHGVDLTIGQFCSIGQDIAIYLAFDHRTDWITTFPFGLMHPEQFGAGVPVGHPASKGSIFIGNDVWIGDGATILSGVRIGHGAVIAGQAVITKDVPDYTIAAGNPARPVKTRFPDEIVALLLELRWWDLQVPEISEIRNLLTAEPEPEQIRQLIQRFRG